MAASLIQSTRYYPARQARHEAFLLCGFGGSIWQLKRLIKVLNRDGYNVTAYDFPKKVLKAGDPTLLPRLADEMVSTLEQKQGELGTPVLLVGVSLGALISLNILRRSKQFDRAVGITGGDIVTVAQNLYPTVWPQSYESLAKQWQDVNMYTNPKQLRGKHMLMVLPARDKLIDPEAVRQEIRKQKQAGNNFILIERRHFGHIGTIMEEAVLFPHRLKGYVAQILS